MMLRPLGGGRPAVEHNFYQQATQVKQLAAQGVPQARRVTLDAVGVKVLAWGLDDFVVKSKGGTAGGVTWRPVLQATIDARTRRLGTFKRLKTDKAKQKQLVKGRVDARIGRDTGRLIASLKAGGNADQIKQITDTSVLVGTQVNYGKHFDAVRPIFGPQFIDAKRQQELEALALRVYERECKRLEGKK